MRRVPYDPEGIKHWFVVDRIPLTKIIIVSNIAMVILIALFFRGGQIQHFLGYHPSRVIFMPWTLFTYPFVSEPQGLISILFAMYWTWVAGGSLERSWGTTKFAWYFFSMVALSALGLFVGGLLTDAQVGLTGMWLPLAGMTVAFAMTNPEQQILFFFIVPLKLKYLALIDVVMVLITYGSASLLLGLFALNGCAYSYWYIQPNRFSWQFPTQRRRDNVTRVYDKPSLWRSLNPFKKIKEERDRERLRKLFERSFDDDDDRGRR